MKNELTLNLIGKRNGFERRAIAAVIRLFAIALLTVAGTLPAHAWKFEFLSPPQGLTPVLAQGGKLGMQLIVDEQILKMINPDGSNKILYVDLEWIAPGSNQPMAMCFPTINKPCLPTFTQMVGPFPDKAFRSNRFWAERSAFPTPGIWALRAKLRNTDVGYAVLHIDVQSYPKARDIQPATTIMKPGLVTPPPAGKSNARGRLNLPTR